MHVESKDFVRKAKDAVQDARLQAAIQTSTTNSDSQRQKVMHAVGLDHAQKMREQAAEAKRRALRTLPELLETAEAAMQANGIEVLWARDDARARALVLEIAERHGVRRIVKSKSMLTEEIGLNPALEARGLEVVETDLGEYIVQLAHEPPSHIVGPALHMSKDSIRDLFMRELGMPFTDNAEEMTQFVRERLRQIFLHADMGISGGNYIVAEAGAVGLCTNEGNGRMVTTLPPVHVALVGIEKIVETLDDYATLLQMMARSSTGQTLTVYNQLICGPRRGDETDGPEHVYVILVDNQRSDIYASEYTEALACLRCGACLNACPVYRVMGGHAYGSVYSGPIGAVITPLLAGMENAHPLPYASSLCGKCKDVCPVIIDLPRMLLDLRADLIEHGHGPALWDAGMHGWAAMFASPALYKTGGWMMRQALRAASRIAPDRLPFGPVGGWTQSRDIPPVSSKSFHQLWQERQKGSGDE